MARKLLSKFKEPRNTILSSGIMLTFNIMISLINNKYVQTRHKTLRTYHYGSCGSWNFTIIFVMYTTQFLLKRNKKSLLYMQFLAYEESTFVNHKHIEFFVVILNRPAILRDGWWIHFGRISFWDSIDYA